MTENPTDGEAIAGSLAEPHAFGVVFERHFGAIHGYLRRRFDDQLATSSPRRSFFFVAFDSRARFDQARPDSRPWLFGIATNLAHRHRRCQLRELRAIAAMTPDDPGAGIEGVEARVDAERMRGILAQSLADLPAEESDVLCLLVWAELNQAEIADALAIPGAWWTSNTAVGSAPTLPASRGFCRMPEPSDTSKKSWAAKSPTIPPQSRSAAKERLGR